MYVQSLEYIHSLLLEEVRRLNSECEEAEECLENADPNDIAWFRELKQHLAESQSMRDTALQVKADFERTNWH